MITSYGRKTTAPFFWIDQGFDNLRPIHWQPTLAGNRSFTLPYTEVSLEAFPDRKWAQFWYVFDYMSLSSTSLSLLLHPLLIKEFQNHLGLGCVELAYLVYCVVQKELPLFFVETAREILSLGPLDEKLETWGLTCYLSTITNKDCWWMLTPNPLSRHSSYPWAIPHKPL